VVAPRHQTRRAARKHARPRLGRRQFVLAVVAFAGLVALLATPLVLARLPLSRRRATTGNRRVAIAPTPHRSHHCPRVSGRLLGEIDGDGCAESVSYAHGILRLGAAEFAVGRDGDVALLGDWSCSGRATVALFRPSTGAVFRFDDWAHPSEDVVATLVA